jgi:Na+/H+ antiporter NhaD/arsenite permease-like protein
MLTAVVVFAVTYALIIARRLRWIPVGRPAGALVGAVLAVGLRVLTPAQAYASIDHGTIALLFGMMVINVHLERAGAFGRAAALLDRTARSPRALLCAVAVFAGVGAALLVNDAVCLMGTSVVLALARRRRLHPLPFLLALAIGSNVGGVMTLTGTPQCMIVGQLGGISYTSYAAAMVPIGVLGLAILCAVLLVVYRAGLPVANPDALAHLDSGGPVDATLLGPAAVAVAVVTAGFVLRYDLAWTALMGAVLLLVLARRDASHALARVDWSVLLFFSGLFVVVGGLRVSGASDALVRHLGPWLRGGPRDVLPFSVVSVAVSNLVSNVPYVLLLARWVSQMADARLMWLALSMAATFAGNLTLLGSVANVIVAEGAGEEGGMGFVSYLRVGLPTTVLTTLAGAGLLLAMHDAGWLRYTAGW